MIVLYVSIDCVLWGWGFGLVDTGFAPFKATLQFLLVRFKRQRNSGSGETATDQPRTRPVNSLTDHQQACLFRSPKRQRHRRELTSIALSHINPRSNGRTGLLALLVAPSNGTRNATASRCGERGVRPARSGGGGENEQTPAMQQEQRNSSNNNNILLITTT